ncbi:MAG: hypothetical protein IJ759_03880 [Bacteroidales bacterium]|nr:hypothetical protein [Bacteroidales bacterium]
MKKRVFILAAGLLFSIAVSAQSEVKVSDLPKNEQGYPYINEKGLSDNADEIVEYKTVLQGTNDTVIYRMNKRRWKQVKEAGKELSNTLSKHYKQSFHITTSSMDELAKYIVEEKSKGYILKEVYESNGTYYVLFVK